MLPDLVDVVVFLPTVIVSLIYPTTFLVPRDPVNP
nr:MAG TPA: hypothetical protein [Bacteriophage sp.]